MSRCSLVFVIALGAAGCSQQDTDGLARVGKKIVAQGASAAGPLRDRFDSGVRGLASVRERVQSRLQWDKQLADVSIEVHVAAGEVELRGNVKTDEQRRRAVELAEMTLGVERLVVQLQVAP